MSPEKDPSIWIAISGILVTLWTGSIAAIGRIFFGKLNTLSADIESLKKQAPSGNTPCAGEDDVKEIKGHIGDLFEGQNKILVMVARMAGKMGVNDEKIT